MWLATNGVSQEHSLTLYYVWNNNNNNNFERCLDYFVTNDWNFGIIDVLYFGVSKL